jgi:hypothetical protein
MSAKCQKQTSTSAPAMSAWVISCGGVVKRWCPLTPDVDIAFASHYHSALCLLNYDYRLVVTNNPREASACVNCWIALSVIAKFLAFSTLRRSVFNAGSLSLITHRHTNILAS